MIGGQSSSWMATKKKRGWSRIGPPSSGMLLHTLLNDVDIPDGTVCTLIIDPKDRFLEHPPWKGRCTYLFIGISGFSSQLYLFGRYLESISHCNQKRCLTKEHPFTQFSWPKIQLKTLDGLQKSTLNFEWNIDVSTVFCKWLENGATCPCDIMFTIMFHTCSRLQTILSRHLVGVFQPLEAFIP